MNDSFDDNEEEHQLPAYRTHEQYVLAVCEACGENFYSKAEIEAEPAKDIAENFTCKYCKRKSAVIYEPWSALPLQDNQVSSQFQMPQGAQNFSNFLSNLDEITKQIYIEHNKLIEKTFLECIEKLLGRVPTDVEVMTKGKAVHDPYNNCTTFYFDELVLFRIYFLGYDADTKKITIQIQRFL